MVLQVVAAVTLVAATLFIDLLASSLTPAKYAAQFGTVPAHLHHCAYIVPRDPESLPGTRGPPPRAAMCLFGSRESHQEAYVSAQAAVGFSIALLLWTAVTGRGFRLVAKYRERQFLR